MGRWQRLLVANRGEVALRVMHAAADLGLKTVAVHGLDEIDAAHARAADETVALDGSGPAAYLDAAAMVQRAVTAGVEAIHPGYGLLAESADLAERCAAAGLVCVGPGSATLRALGPKTDARALAEGLGVPVLEACEVAEDASEAARLFDRLGGAPIMLKAVAGGGGRGLRVVRDRASIDPAFAACRLEADRSFGDPRVFAERLLERARHVEVQILGDGGAVVCLGDRDCSLQRRRQKLIEIAPAPDLPPEVRRGLHLASVRMAEATSFVGLGTFEFLVDPAGQSFFVECNPRLQVEHTVTEEITGLDLVVLQLEVARGASLAELGLETPPPSRGSALQLRVNAETIDAAGRVVPSGGVLRDWTPPVGAGVRTETAARVGDRLDPRFDPLFAKLVVRVTDGTQSGLLHKARRALSELRVAGVHTNASLLASVLGRRELESGWVGTTFVEDLGLLSAWGGRQEGAPPPTSEGDVVAPMAGVVVSVAVRVGDHVQVGEELVVLEALKMHHGIVASGSGVVTRLRAEPGARVEADEVLLELELAPSRAQPAAPAAAPPDLDAIRPELADLNARLARTLDAQRPAAVKKRHARGQRTARENVEALCDPGSFAEYGQLAVAAQRRTRPLEELIDQTPADGLVAGFGTINADVCGEEAARAAVLAYDYTVLAGTQGMFNHKKTDRVLELARDHGVPVVFFCEGGGGRPSDTDYQEIVASTLDVRTFATYASGSGTAPRIGIASGPCFAGNAVLFGCSDLTIATERSYVGMAGPAMIEAGGLGACRTEEIGPIDVQFDNGVVDLRAADEVEAARLARQTLSYFQGRAPDFKVAEQRALRHVIPEDRKRSYDVRSVARTLFDVGSFLELRGGYGRGMVTGLARLAGHPVAVYANDPRHLGGAIDADGADKASMFMQLADTFGLPLIALMDTPGFMVGPEHEREAAVRRTSRLLVTAAGLRVPILCVGLRKGYGLGAQAMAGGSFWSPFLHVAWPTGEFGPMGLEGAVRLALRKELAAAPTAEAREALFETAVARRYEAGGAISTASVLEIDAVIDPAETRRFLLRGLKTALAKPRAHG